MPLPLQSECNQDDPEEAFVWAFIGLPGPRNGPMLVPQQVLGKWAKHLWDLGFRHHPDLQQLEYHPATPGSEHWLSQAGSWVPVGTPMPPEVSMPSVLDLSMEERRELVRQLQESGELGHLVDMRDLTPDVAQEGTFGGAAR
ncbi:phage gene 29 protein family protein [Nocardia asteroides]|uniref:phage gene 29 protein family protein n=1 Tax=Nocardia asteroides TaxID=1824 RepID=UPI0034210A44